MGMELPRDFTVKMERLLGGGEFEAFLASYEEKRWYGLRLNALKIDAELFAKVCPWKLEPIPWVEGGYYYGEELRPGKHPFYHAGLYYIQEPSAMAPAELLDVKPGHKVLDLCAAPGGKSTQLAGKLKGRGVLVANDNARERTKALAKNIELAGVRNAVVLNEEPERLARAFGAYFDRILVDAPCSGEGMFRKEESMIAQWEKHSVERCCVMQRDILRHAAAMLAPGGRLVYSTCTFSPEENEAQIVSVLADHPELSVVPVPLAHGWSAGRPEWAADESGVKTAALDAAVEAVSGTVRLWPHKVRGEGHYAAVLVKAGSALTEHGHGGLAGERVRNERIESAQIRSDGDKHRADSGGKGSGQRGRSRRGSAEKADSRYAASSGRDHSQSARLRKTGDEAAAVQLWKEFALEQLHSSEAWEGKPVCYGSRLYLQPPGIPSLDGLQTVRPGWYLGETGKRRFEPSQPLAMGLKESESVLSLRLRSEEEATLRYLKGETIQVDAERFVCRPPGEVGGGNDRVREYGGDSNSVGRKGYVLVCVDGYPVGWGKWDGVMLKNGISAGWRWT